MPFYFLLIIHINLLWILLDINWFWIIYIWILRCIICILNLVKLWICYFFHILILVSINIFNIWRYIIYITFRIIILRRSISIIKIILLIRLIGCWWFYIICNRRLDIFIYRLILFIIICINSWIFYLNFFFSI